jgi:NAD(P)-dependent dehydrogenase (short-subunit alcohol dehydrogenase family)
VVTYELNGKVAFITGAARGIGYELGRMLHARGAAVALADVNREGVERAAAGFGADRALALELDVRDADAVEAAVAAVVERFGGLDLPVANAGVAPEPRTMLAGDPQAFERVLDINLTGVTNTVRASLPQVVERKGHVVVIASIYAFMNGALAMPYAMSKAAVEQLGRALRVELGPHGASATVAYFGFVDTAMVRDAFEDPIARRFEQLFPSFAMRRIGPDAAAAALLAGIERRAPRVIAPRWWKAVATLRSIAAPLMDRRLERDENVRSVIQEAEQERAPDTLVRD